MSREDIYTIEELKDLYPKGSSVYQFYTLIDLVPKAENFKRMIRIGEPLVINIFNKDNQIEVVKTAFEKLVEETGIDRNEISCTRHRVGNTWTEEYGLLNNGAYERSGVREHFESWYKPKDNNISEKYNLLAKAVNESTDECLPTCDSYGHEENCPTITPAIWIENLQRKVDNLSKIIECNNIKCCYLCDGYDAVCHFGGELGGEGVYYHRECEHYKEKK